MKEWKEVTKIPFSTEDFFKYVMEEEDAGFWKIFHNERGHYVENIPGWAPCASIQEINNQHVKISSHDLYNYKSDEFEWMYRVDKFRLPVPLPKAVLKYLFRGAIPENGHLVHNTVFRPSAPINGREYVMEAVSVPQEGLLADKFIAHLIYHVKPDPENDAHSVFEFTGRVTVHKMPPITSAVEAFSVPFSKNVQRQWTDLMLNYLRSKCFEK